ncbi:unnamed protein product [Polarella glacialis]|uniref:Uncharacterized protein n=1 Tax=Polarella glacialis TaxID=89957 RepID=A0A813DF84_POLGL|nr:unnamed protein product [Polarella glacialis]
MPPEKRWRPAVTAPGSGEAAVEDWKNHPRLQKHVRRFLDSSDPGRVLSRYSAQAQNLDQEKLLRIAVHVGAWVALLPVEQAAVSSCGEDDVSRPSPVQLLAQILHLRGRAKITDWLQGVLHLVARRLQDVRRNVQGQAAAPWIELRRSMPKAIWRDLRTQRPAIPPTCSKPKEKPEPADPVKCLKRKPPPEQSEPAGARVAVEVESDMFPQSGGPAFEVVLASDFHLKISELGNEKAVRRFYHDEAAFSKANFDERSLQLDALEARLVKAVASESWDKVCSLIREAAAALAAPRQKAALEEAAAPMPEDAQELLQANLQSKLRKLVCKGLGYVDLSDAGTASQLEPALSFMKLLIERFKARGQLEEARAAKQWLRLQGILTGEAKTETDANLENSLTEASRRKEGTLRTTKGGVYTPGQKIQDNALVRNTGRDVVLTCNKCGVELRSSWVFDYRGKLQTLVPTNGHTACRDKYISVTGIPLVRDTLLDICPHNTRLSICVKCGGNSICIHKKQRFQCQLCKAAATTQSEVNLDSSQPEGRVKRRSVLKTTKGGVYTPGQKIQDNPLVRNTGHDVLLICNKCGVELRSSWVFDCRGKVQTLVPNNGHGACGGKYVSVTGIPLFRDSSGMLDICPHESRRSTCVKCGGSEICIHKKRKYDCMLCKAAGYKKRTRRQHGQFAE